MLDSDRSGLAKYRVRPTVCWADRSAMRLINRMLFAIIVTTVMACGRPEMPPDPAIPAPPAEAPRTAEGPSTPSPLSLGISLEVTAHEWGIGWSESYTYLRVREDGRAECDVLKWGRRSFVRVITHVKRVSGRLSPGALDSLASTLEDPDFPPPPRPVEDFVADGGTLWNIAWRKDSGEVHGIEVCATTARSCGGIRDRAQSVLDLVCFIAKARSEVTGEASEFDDCGSVAVLPNKPLNPTVVPVTGHAKGASPAPVPPAG